MNQINWKVRAKNKAFWISLIPAILLFVQAVLNIFGYDLEVGDIGNKLMIVVNAIFTILAVLGIVTDPTTEGIGDSSQVLTYDEPKCKL